MANQPRGLLGGLRSMIGGLTGLPAAPRPAGGGRPSSSYMRGGRNVTFAGWRPPLREAQDDIGEAWDTATARTIDLIEALHNLIGGTATAIIAAAVWRGMLERWAMPQQLWPRLGRGHRCPAGDRLA